MIDPAKILDELAKEIGPIAFNSDGSVNYQRLPEIVRELVEQANNATFEEIYKAEEEMQSGKQ